MSDENIDKGQATGGGAAHEAQPFDPASYEVDVGGRRLTVDNLQKSYLEAEGRMRKSDSSVAELTRKLEGYGWADEVVDRYNNDSSFRSRMDKALSDDEYGDGGNQIHALHPITQQLSQQQQQLSQITQERQFDALRKDGYNLDTNDEVQVLNLIATNPRVRDVKAAYLSLFAQREIARARESASEQTAENINKSRGTYSPAPKGKSSSPGKPDVKKMSEAERDAYGVERLRELYD